VKITGIITFRILMVSPVGVTVVNVISVEFSQPVSSLILIVHVYVVSYSSAKATSVVVTSVSDGSVTVLESISDQVPICS